MAYLSLSTSNLPEPTISPADDASPKDHFNILGWQGRSSVGTSSYTGLGFQPDFTWIKCRNTAHHHYLVDGLRGPNNVLSSNLIAAEPAFTPDEFVSFDSDGITVEFASGGGRTNYSSDGPYISWNWKANGSGVSNTDGSITSTVSANTTSGFSIVSYTGTGTAGSTVGHGLDSAPEMIIVKNRIDVIGWPVYTATTGSGNNLVLNTTDASASTSNWNNTSPTSSVFSVGGTTGANGSGDSMIAYCFHSVEGFSKFGSYTGNNNPDGPFVYTGFRPSFVMTRPTGTGNWSIYDSTRESFNDGDSNMSFADSGLGETSFAASAVDLLSNGFKIRHSTADGYSNPSSSVIYMAFAENPFKYSNAR